MDVLLRGIRSLQIPLISFQVLGGQYLLKCGDVNLVTETEIQGYGFEHEGLKILVLAAFCFLAHR